MVKQGPDYTIRPPNTCSAGKRWWGPGRRQPAWAWLVGLGMLLVIAGCGYHANPDDVREYVVFANDFEHMAGWLPENAPALSTERAHSGRYSVRVDKEHPYSLTYRLTVGKAFSRRPHRMRLSAWVWVAGADDNAQLVFTLGLPAPNTPPLFSTRLFLADNWPYKRWTHLSRDIDLPPEFPSQSQLNVYLWHCTAQDAVFADDWQLTELH